MSKELRYPRESLACIIVGRNLGDAVIQYRFVRDLVERGYAKKYIVWTRPQVAFLYEGLPDCEIVTSQFPVGTSKQFDAKAFYRFSKAILKIRNLGPSVSIDLVGDFRERLLARLIGSRQHKYIGWAEGHPFAKIIRNPFGPGTPTYVVPAALANVYKAHDAFLETLICKVQVELAETREEILSRGTAATRIGLHPFASQNCKLWPAENWLRLAESLQQRNVELVAYGAPSDREALETMFNDLQDPIEYVTGSISGFSRDVAKLDLMVGLDSFSVHMAARHGVRSIMLNACNHPTLWIPPLGVGLTNSGGCPAYPCMNVPVCETDSVKYRCIKSIPVDTVLESIEEVI